MNLLPDPLKPLRLDDFTGDLAHDVPHFLRAHGFPKTADHSADVAATSRQIATRFGLDAAQAEATGWLHDISAVFPAASRVEVARALEIDVLPEEETFPMIVHQKLSVVVARHLFGIEDAAILSAIGCHTTLKLDASPLDTAVFVADKIAWDQPGTPPYLDAITSALDQSLDHAAFVYLSYLWEMRESLRVVHPWMRDAYHQIKARLQA